jgi:hypothetical protein
LLAVLSAVLPEGKVVFMVNGANMPIVPIAGLLMLGVLLLASSVRRRLA